ncbi:hypothetical protein [Capnocytophaga felis]|uniref:Lipoprotein n=1 Tax=Capnocytophaga felis TaxID=2267611 RepID=A0A5M4B874_9FLAO|nr:hypothetical protein [Capnocytophaga felis]GET45457.1 hypothetical protein RCZ01_07590 [Capnocytophaga felis]GET47380.1 hypothetical protein RCZ02_02110 [Capnocytophaga felis]
MRKVNYVFGLLIVLAISVLSCKKDDNSQEVPQLEPPYIRMKVDGEWWISKEKLDDFTVYPAGESNAKYPWEMEAKGINKDTWEDDLYEFKIRFPFKEKPQVGKTYTFQVTNPNQSETNFELNFREKPKGKNTSGYTRYSSHFVTYVNGVPKKVDSHPITVTITELKQLQSSPDGYTEYLVSGTFSGKMIHKESKKVIEITDGEFKSVIKK